MAERIVDCDIERRMSLEVLWRTNTHVGDQKGALKVYRRERKNNRGKQIKEDLIKMASLHTCSQG